MRLPELIALAQAYEVANALEPGAVQGLRRIPEEILATGRLLGLSAIDVVKAVGHKRRIRVVDAQRMFDELRNDLTARDVRDAFLKLLRYGHCRD